MLDIFVIFFTVLIISATSTVGLIIRDKTLYSSILVNRTSPDATNYLSALFVALINHIHPEDYRDDAERILQSMEYSTGPFTSNSLIMSVTEWESLMNPDVSPQSTSVDIHRLSCPLYKINYRREEMIIILVFDVLEDRSQCQVLSLYPDEPLQFFHPFERPLTFSPTIALTMKNLIERRYEIKINFYLPETASSSPVEIAWAHFRGNTRIVSIGGDGDGEPLLLYPGESVVQYTHAGHLFVIREWSRSSNKERQCFGEHMDQCSDEGSSLSLSQRILSLYLVPSITSINSIHDVTSIDITIDIGKSLNTDILKQVSKSQMYHSKEGTDRDEDQKHVLTQLWTYWEYQRRCQMHLNSWFLPSLPLTLSSSNGRSSNRFKDNNFGLDLNSGMREIPTSSLRRKVQLPTSITVRAQNDYYDKKRSNVGHYYQAETAISMVFNQHEVDTFYVPLESSLLREMESLVIQESASWLGIPPQDWQVSSSYGIREYRRNAIVRWHVDPTESQPITAIIHIADSMPKHDSSILVSQIDNSWAIEVPKTITGTENDLQPENLEEILLQEGEMLLIQTAKLPHARLKKLQMDNYANAFVHIAPKYWHSQPVVQLMY